MTTLSHPVWSERQRLEASRGTGAKRGAVLLSLLLLLSCDDPPAAGSVRDSLGRQVRLPARIGRVVTLAPNITEIVFAVGEGGRVVGTDDASNHPPPVAAVPKVGAMQPNVEKIVALRPDLVLASTEGNHPALASALAAARVPLYVVKTDRLAEIPGAMREVGRILGARGAAAAAGKLEREMAAQRRSRTAPPRLVFAVWTDPLYVAGTATFADDLIALTGARNAVERSGWPQYPLELLAASPPDVLLYPSGSVTPAHVDALLARLPGPKPAAVAVDQDLFQRPGPRMAEAAARLNEILDALPRGR